MSGATTSPPLRPVDGSASATDWPALRVELLGLLQGRGDAFDLLGAFCARLLAAVPRYSWVGFYLVDPGACEELVLGPFAGPPTDHRRIPFGRGICGQAALRQEPIIVPDVRVEGNYLACSIEVRSEIVLPIFAGRTPAAAGSDLKASRGRFVGELDIDSPELAGLSPADASFLSELCLRCAPLVQRCLVPGGIP